MKTILLSILVLGGVVFSIYLIWAIFIPMRIGQTYVDRKVTENSQQYVESQRSALLNLNNSYTSTNDPTYKAAIKAQMCDIANKLPSTSDIPGAVMPVVGGCI
jgi:hypothetical protein